MSRFSQSQLASTAPFLPSIYPVNSATSLALLRVSSSISFGHAGLSCEAHYVALTIWTTSILTQVVDIYTLLCSRQSEGRRNLICIQADVNLSPSKSKAVFTRTSYRRTPDVSSSSWLVSSQVRVLHLIHSLPRKFDLTLTFFLL